MATATDEATVIAWMRSIDAKLDRLLSNVSDRKHVPPSSLSRGDRALLARLLPAIGGALGSEPFTSRDLAANSAPGLRLVLPDLSVKQIGRLLSRAEGIALAGWLVARCGVEINVTLWRVVATVSDR